MQVSQAVKNHGWSVTLDVLRDSLRDAIPQHAHAREIRHINRFPRNRSFKVDRIGLRERLAE